MISSLQDVLRLIRRETVPLLLIAFSLFLLLALGLILDILLVNWPSLMQDTMGGAALPSLTQWVLDNISGFRGLPCDIAIFFWLVIVFAFVATGLSVNDGALFRTQFICSFLFIWSVALALFLFVLVALALPFNILLGRLDSDAFSIGDAIRVLSVVLVVAIIALPTGVIFKRRRKNRKTTGTEHQAGG